MKRRSLKLNSSDVFKSCIMAYKENILTQYFVLENLYNKGSIFYTDIIIQFMAFLDEYLFQMY